MQRLIFLLLISTIFSSGINSIGFTYGKPSGQAGTLSQSNYDGDCSFNLNFQKHRNNSSIIYFIEYNRFESNSTSEEYEMYLLGIGYQSNPRITNKLTGNLGVSLGISDDQYTLDFSDYDNFTFDDNYFFLRYNLGFSFILNNKTSISLKYNNTFTNEQYGYTTSPQDNLFEDNSNISYDSILLGLNFRIRTRTSDNKIKDNKKNRRNKKKRFRQ